MMAIQEVDGGDSILDEWIEEEWRKRRLEVALKEVRSQVTAGSWQVFELRYFEQLPFEEIAERLEIRIGTAYTRFCRVIKKLKEAVEESDE